MASFPNQEHRPLKRLRLGPIGPEVYPQDKKQKEDEISQSSVKHGFNNMPCIKDEFASAKDALLNSGGVPLITKVSTAFNALLSKKQELSTLQDQAKRKPQMMKDNFYPIGIARGKQMSETWLRDDLATTKPLSLITKKVPVFNKREDVFQKLCEENIPPYRAAWYIKLANTYNILICDVAKAKKRQVVDPCQEWTVAMTRHLREQLQKIAEHYNNSASNMSSSSTSVVMNTSFLTAGGGAGRQMLPNPDLGLEPSLRQWNYNCRLVLHLFDDGLLDKQDFLSWLIDQLEKYCGGSRMNQQSNEDAMLKILVVQVVKHMNEFAQSQMLSRRLAYFCCKKLSLMCSDGTCSSTPVVERQNEPSKAQTNQNSQSAFSIQSSIASGNGTASTSGASNNSSNADNNQNNNGSNNPNQVATFSDCANCPQHRGLLMNLSAIVQAIVISCPAALVWHDLGEGKQFSTLNGSPLDLLPCSPLVLPMPAGDDNKEIREMLMVLEEEIIHRSEMSESKWSVDKQRQTNTGVLVSYILSCLEALDRHGFDKVDSNNCLDTLFNKIFTHHSTKDGPEHFSIDEPAVNLLCEWAVTTKRSGIHRTIVVAKLLERYQNHVTTEKSSDTDPSEDKDGESIPCSSYSSSSHPPFQSILFNFLDEKAPHLDENPSQEARVAFYNLILLFCELIRHDIFSHDVYVSTLIARGDLMNATSILPIIQNYHVLMSEGQAKTENSSKQENSDVTKMEIDEFSIFESKDDVRPSPDQPASVRSLLDQQCLLPSSMPPCIARTPGAPMTPVNLRTSAPHTPSGCGVPTPNSHTPGGNQTPYHSMVHTPGGHVPTPVGHVHTPGGSQSMQQHTGGMMGVVGGASAASMMSGGSMMIGHQQPMMDGRSLGLSGVSPYVNPMISPHSQQLHHLQQQQLHHHQMQLHHQQMQQQQQQQYCPVPSPAGALHHHHFQQTPNPMMPNNSNQQLLAAHLPPHATTPIHHPLPSQQQQQLQVPLQQQQQQSSLQQQQQSSIQQQQQQSSLQQQQQTPQQQHQPDPPSNQLAHGKDVRHILYVLHFPVTSGDPCSHENNQRAVVLCGFGKAREEARHAIKKATKEILKLFSKKNCIDAINGELNNKVKKKKDKDKVQDSSDSAINIENLFQRFKKLSYHSQHVVTHSVSKNLVELVSSFASGTSQLLPSVENVSHLFDLMESCFNISHLLALAIKLLTDIPEVETQLVNKGSILVGAYTTNLCLCLVGIFRMYHACLLLAQDQTVLVFENLCRVVKHVDRPSECSSAERVILAYLYDLYTSCNFLKAKYADMFGGPCMKVKATIFCEIEPASSNLRWEESFSRELMENPRRKIDHSFVKQLSDVPADRYSFVCSVLYNVCSCHNVDKVNDIASLCAELTACCNVLSSEWLGVLKALCWSSNHNCGFIDVLTQVDVGDLSIHDSLAVFTAILIARHCFTLDDVITQVFLQSLLSACPTVGSGGDPDCELGARLTCHLLLRLFQMMTPGSSGSGSSGAAGNGGGSLGKNGSAMFIKSSRDRHLIETSHKRVNLSALVSVLKAILMLGECPTGETREIKPGGFAKKSSNILDGLDSPDISMRSLSRSKNNVENAGLSEYAKYCLKEICQQTWVRESFLREPEDLLTPSLLLDRMLSHKQARHLVHLICHPDGGYETSPKSWTNDDDDDDDSDTIGRVLRNMNQWTLGVSWLELQLMVKQASQLEMGSLLDSIAKGTIEVFQQQNKDKLQKTPQSQNSQDSDDAGNNSNGSTHDSVWFIAPLISKLSPAVQGKILRTAGTVLETGNNFWSAKNSKDKERYLQKSTSLLGNQPFLCLVLSCLKGQDEQREGLLKSLHDQLEKFVANSKEQERMVPSDEILQFMMQEALQLRLSLVGSMFDTIQRNNNLVQDWCILLVQLVCCGVVDIQSNGELLTTVIDMLAVLINGTLAHDNSDKTEEGKKFYQNLMRKLKKELGEKKSPSIDLLRQVLLIPKVYCEIIVSEPLLSSDPKSQKSNDHDRGQSLQVTRKERVSPWEIMENQRNPAPLNLSWFGAVRKEKKVLKYEEQHRLLLYHTHSVKKPESYYLEPPVLPPEEMEQPPEKPVQELKPMEQMFEAKPETSKAKKTGRNRTNKKQPQSRPVMAQPPHYMQPGGMPNPSMGFNRPEMYPSTVPVQNWYNGQPYPSQMPPGANAGRAYPAGAVPNPRQMLNNVLKTRHPMQQQQQQAFIATPGVPAQAQQPQNVGWVRQRGGMARGARLNIEARAAIFAQQPGQQPAGAPMGTQHFAAQPSQAVGYPGYASQAMPTQMEPAAQGMMNQPYQQQGTSVGYAVSGQGPPGQYPQQASSRYGNMTGGSGGLQGYNQMIRGAANPSQPSNFAASAAMQAPHQQQRLLRHQILMQQQQQQQHRQGQQNLPFNSFHG